MVNLLTKCHNLFIILLLIGCNEKVIIEPDYLEQFDGNWEERYHFSYDPHTLLYTEENNIEDTIKNASTHIQFKDNMITVLTLPQHRNYYLFSNASNLADTLYKGYYEIKKDTIIINIKALNNQEDVFYKLEEYDTFKFIYTIINNELNLRVVIPLSEDPYAYPLYYSSFLWGYSFDKRYGTFKKK